MSRFFIGSFAEKKGIDKMSNSNLQSAKKAKNDEFYTRREDIENELSHYSEHFKGKVVYCNCDDPEWSEFVKFFKRNFKAWGMKKLIATHYELDEKNYAYYLEYNEHQNDGMDDEPVIVPLQCNGDFRSDACVKLLEEADIVVTNPPFSLFREYVAQLMEYNKKFLILGSVNAVTYKEIFPLIKENKLWAGFCFNKTMEFIMPDTYELKGKAYVDENGKKHGFVPGIAWYTNMDIKKRHDVLDLRGNYYDAEKYPTYVNYNAIEVSKVNDIPCDYDGLMGVPITFMDRYNPEQFEIVGYSLELAKPMNEVALKGTYMPGGRRFYSTRLTEKDVSHGYMFHREYDRIVIRNKHLFTES